MATLSFLTNAYKDFCNIKVSNKSTDDLLDKRADYLHQKIAPELAKYFGEMISYSSISFDGEIEWQTSSQSTVVFSGIDSGIIELAYAPGWYYHKEEYRDGIFIKIDTDILPIIENGRDGLIKYLVAMTKDYGEFIYNGAMLRSKLKSLDKKHPYRQIGLVNKENPIFRLISDITMFLNDSSASGTHDREFHCSLYFKYPIENIDIKALENDLKKKWQFLSDILNNSDKLSRRKY